MKCKVCIHRKSHGRAQTQCGKLGRKKYWCENPEAEKLPTRAFGNSAACFIGFGEHNFESPLKLKTHPKWCPIKEGGQQE